MDDNRFPLGKPIRPEALPKADVLEPTSRIGVISRNGRMETHLPLPPPKPAIETWERIDILILGGSQ